MNIRKTQSASAKTHKEVSENNTPRRTVAQKRRNAKNSVLSLDIKAGDFVKVRMDSTKERKLQPNWKKASENYIS